MDEACSRLGISRSTLINRCIIAGLKDEEKALIEGRGATNSEDPHQPAFVVPNATTTTPQETNQEVEAV